MNLYRFYKKFRKNTGDGEHLDRQIVDDEPVLVCGNAQMFVSGPILDRNDCELFDSLCKLATVDGKVWYNAKVKVPLEVLTEKFDSFSGVPRAIADFGPASLGSFAKKQFLQRIKRYEI